MSPFPSRLRWLYVDLNSYFASVEQQEHPELRGKPVIVTPIDSDYTSAIAASYEAKALGVKTGISVRDARQICPSIAVIAARHDVYVRYHHRIREEIEQHIPVTQTCSIDEFACALMGAETAPEAAGMIAQTIQNGILNRVGRSIRCSVGIAPGKLLAKMASDMQKPMGLTILPANHLPDILYGLDLQDIPGVGRRIGERLRRAGIDSIEKLWNCSPGRARALWRSIEGERIWYALHGVDPPEIVTQHHSVSHSYILPPQLRTHEAARQTSRQLLMRAGARLRRMERRAGALSLSVRLITSGWLGQTRRFPATNSTSDLLCELDRLWRMVEADASREPVKKVGVTLHHLDAPDSAQLEFFVETTVDDARAQALSTALDRVNSRYGRDTVTIGMQDKNLSRFIGAKIAFTRVPDHADFEN